ncbi:MFS transporter [Burkholderia ubonensis]|uniref:MFS transporter n=1 Tax=Burkholderia ubonensis TaxID=101571 RepID=UPI00075432DF|nr:MFS transporter [Burkholderia ubonensis]KVP48746.1 MFS transporter [Burkholderia ubonensis]KVR53744.1 MFS transporter [Burkholderia ubonensis]OJB01155.1 MFS transporter [Burkholderia ubonensis]
MSHPFRAAASLSGRSVAALSAACGFAVANLYYSQPLLPQMAATFGSDASAQGAIAMLTQAGYAAGLLLFGPLGDRIDRRRLITALLLTNMVGLALCATAANLNGLLVACVVVGLTAVSAQIIIPAVSGLADPALRGQTVGRLMSGLFAGTLLARTASGYVGAHAGWRAMFMLAAVLDAALIALVWRHLPHTRPDSDLSYPKLLASLGQLLKQQPLLREACLAGFLLFAAFNVLWGSLALMLARPPYGYGSEVAGLFGMVGVTGMLASPTIGRLTDHWGGRRVVATAAALVMLAFALVAGSMQGIGFLIAGVVILDLGSRASLVANQTRLYAALPHARGRLNTVFMTCYFLGGAAGSALGTAMAGRFGWSGVASAGVLCAALALGTAAACRRKRASMDQPASGA